MSNLDLDRFSQLLLLGSIKERIYELASKDSACAETLLAVLKEIDDEQRIIINGI